jgi:hypothetical protein
MTIALAQSLEIQPFLKTPLLLANRLLLIVTLPTAQHHLPVPVLILPPLALAGALAKALAAGRSVARAALRAQRINHLVLVEAELVVAAAAAALAMTVMATVTVPATRAGRSRIKRTLKMRKQPKTLTSFLPACPCKYGDGAYALLLVGWLLMPTTGPSALSIFYDLEDYCPTNGPTMASRCSVGLQVSRYLLRTATTTVQTPTANPTSHNTLQ